MGSFLLVVADRIVTNRSFITGRSKCDGCGHTLSWLELIPVMSYLFQKGKCKHCHTTLSIWYPLSEIITGAVFLITFLVSLHLSPMLTVLHLIVVSCLLIIFFADRAYGIIPFPVVVIATLASVGIIVLSESSSILVHGVSGIVASLLFFIVFFVTRGKGMGFGDVVYAFFMGFLLGFPAIIFGLYIAFITGAVVSLILVMLRKKRLRGGTIPFGPFLVLGTFIMLIAKDQIVQLVSRYFGFV